MQWFNSVVKSLPKLTSDSGRRMPRPHTRHLHLESLERREMMAIDLSAPVVDDLLPRGSINQLYDNHFLLVGDCDHNGYSDVLIIDKPSCANRLVLNNGDGQFVNRDDLLPRGSINQLYDNDFVVAGDFDGNGYAD